MRQLRFFFALAAVTACGWFFVKSGLGPSSVGGLLGGTNVPLGQRNGQTVRIASFNIQVFGESKLANPNVMNVLVQIVRQFDVVAIQEVRARSQDIVAQFVHQINSSGAHYDYVIGPRLGRTSSKEQYAFIFDAASIEVDRQSVYTVDDPDDLLHREPLVAGFRVRGPPPNEAFTFTLVDIHTDPDETVKELNVLDDVVRAVRNDGRGEDDIILLGDLNVDDRHLGELGQMPYLVHVLAGIPSNTRGSHLYDNVLFDGRATVEFTGRAGVLDFAKQFGLTLDQALEVSDHCPVWAEFTIREGGLNGTIATRPATRR